MHVWSWWYQGESNVLHELWSVHWKGSCWVRWTLSSPECMVHDGCTWKLESHDGLWNAIRQLCKKGMHEERPPHWRWVPTFLFGCSKRSCWRGRQRCHWHHQEMSSWRTRMRGISNWCSWEGQMLRQVWTLPCKRTCWLRNTMLP